MAFLWWLPISIAAALAASGDGASVAVPTARIFYLDIRGGRVLSANPDGSDPKVLRDGLKMLPDGIVVDTVGKHIFWTNMGKPSVDDGSIQRMDLDGGNLTTIVPVGATFTAKQLKLDARHGKLYWSDREGMRIQRANLDGSNVETLIETGHGDVDRKDARNWCVGMALDVERGQLYWTQKGNDNAGQGRIFRAAMEIPKGEDPAHRTDVKMLFDHLPEPIDLDVDLSSRLLYWTDRGDPPSGNTVNRAPMDGPYDTVTILTGGLQEGIGISLDLPHDRMFFTDLGGNVYTSTLHGQSKKVLLSGQGSLTGIVYVELPK